MNNQDKPKGVGNGSKQSMQATNLPKVVRPTTNKKGK